MSQVHQSMAEVIKAVSYIAKKRSQGVNYEFRGIDDVMNHLHGPLAQNHLFLSPRVLDDWQVNLIPGTPTKDGQARSQTQALFRICVDVYADDGSMVTLGPGLAQSHDYGDKAVYQAQQNAIKYLLLEAFAIPTAELDMDAVTPDPIAVDDLLQRQLNQIKADVLEAVGDRDKAVALFDQAVNDLEFQLNDLSHDRLNHLADHVDSLLAAKE